MRRLRLQTFLILVNVGLLLLAISGVAYVAVGLLTRLSDEQALALVTQADTSANQALRRDHDELATTAQLLTERPTLQRLVQTSDIEGAQRFLNQFIQTSQIDSCAVLRNGQLVVQCGAALPWAAIYADNARAGTQFWYAPPGNAPLVMGAQDDIAALPGTTVLVALLMQPSFAKQISTQIGMHVTISRPANAPANDARAALRQQALATNALAAARLNESSAYVAALTVRAASGAQVGLVEVELPTTTIDQSLRRLIMTLVLLTLAVAVLATLISLAASRQFSTPLRRLTKAAAQIGRGDLATPVPSAPGAEIGTLATTLEDMRRRLFTLTVDLRRQQAEAQAILTGIVEGVFTVDRERRITYLNPQAAAMLDITPADALGRFCGDVLNPQGAGGVRPCAEHCPIVHARFRGGARATEHLLLRDGQRRSVVITSAPPAEAQQVQVLRDETEIEATRRVRDTVLANISHEFRTPLSAQLASIELLLDQLPVLSTDQIGDLIMALQRGTLRLTQLIDNLLESVRIEAGQDNIRRQSVPLDDVIEAAVELTQPLLDQRGQRVVVDLPYPLASVTGDAQRLTQVFVNLLANANKFSPRDSTISIGGDVQPQSVALWVEDQGPGLAVNASETLFGRFQRAPDGEPEQNGIGLGLAIVKSIVERHGGHVNAQSSASGTRMTVLLPRARNGIHDV
jgi:signal transduction histidine kinase